MIIITACDMLGSLCCGMYSPALILHDFASVHEGPTVYFPEADHKPMKSELSYIIYLNSEITQGKD
jgi:hypothetical protein